MIRSARLAAALALVLGAAGVARAQTGGKGVPDDGEANFAAARSHLQDGRTDLAIGEFRAAIKKDGKNPYFYHGLGVALAQKNELKDALSAFRKSLELNPYYVQVRNDIGSVLLLMGEREEGKKELMTAFNDPTNSMGEVTARNLGNAFFEEKKYEEAVSWYRSSVNRNPGYPDAYQGLADSLIALGRVDEAIVQLQAGLKEVPEYPGLKLSLGRAYFEAGRFKESRNELEEVVKKDPVGPDGKAAAELLKTVPK
jgi:Flp pilus assembly protein TadD